jgi:PAS domain S-box-containing protein
MEVIMSEMNNKSILLVEDEIFIATMEIQELKKFGYHVIHAEGGDVAIDIVKNRNEKIDIILMDIDLGESKDGTQVAEEILKDHDIPILFLSSRTETGIVKKTERITSYGYVVKNSGITVLDASIKMAFKLYAANKKNQIQKEQLGTILHSIGDAVIATDNSGAIIQMNTVAESLTGYLYEDAKGKKLDEVFKIFNSITREVCKNPVELVLASGAIIGLANHTVLVSKQGKEYQISDSGSPIKNANGNITGVVLVFRDVTGEYQIQRKIEESEKRLRTLFKQAAVGVAEIETLTGSFLEINKRYAEIIGLTEDEMLTTNFQSITHPDDLEADLNNMRLLVDGTIQEFSMEKRYIKKNGDIVWVLLTVSPMWQVGELPTHHIAVVQDITERKLAEKQIQQLTHLYSTLSKINQSVIDVRNLNDFYNSICSESIKCGEFLLAWIGIVNYETGFVKSAAHAGYDFGYINSLQINIYDEVTGMGPTSSAINTDKIIFSNDIITDGRMAIWRKEATDRGFRSSVAIPFRLKEKVIGAFNLYSSVSSFFSTPEEMELLEKIGDNISFALNMIEVESERKKVEEALRKNEALYSSLVNSMPFYLYRIDINGCLTFVNKSLLETFKVSLEDIIGKSAYDFYPIELAKKYNLDDRKVIETGQTISLVEENINHATGERIFVEVIKQPIFDSEGRVDGLQGIFYDITERKLANEKIQSLLEEKEHILKEIHHRVKNNMSTVFSLLTIHANEQKDLDVKNILQDAASRVQSMMVLYDKLYRAENENAVSIREYFPSLIQEIVRLFTKREIIEIETDLEDIILNAKILSSLGILINELITNSMKYAFIDRGRGKIKVTAFKKQNNVFIIFEDNGNGIPETISLESSTGFGLQLVNILARQIKGAIALERNNGTKFTIKFPV